MSEASFFVEAPAEGGKSSGRGFVLRTLRHQRVAMGAALFLVAMTVTAILAPWIAPYPLHPGTSYAATGFQDCRGRRYKIYL